MEDKLHISVLCPIEKNTGDAVRTGQPASPDLCGVCAQVILATLVSWTHASWYLQVFECESVSKQNQLWSFIK